MINRVWLIWITAECFTLWQFLVQLSAGIIVQPIMTDFAVSATAAAVLTSSFYYIYISLQIPVGLIMDQVGPRILLSLGALVCGLGSILFSWTDNFYMAFVGRLLMGGGAAFAFVGTLYIIREWFPENRYAFLLGISEMLGMFWAVLGTVVFAAFLEDYGWRLCMLGSGIGFLLSSILSALFIRNHNPAKLHTKAKSGISLRFTQRLQLVLRHILAWRNSLYCGLMFSVVTVFVAMWGTPFLQLLLNTSLENAATVGSMAYIGVALGCPLYGWLSQRLKKRRALLIFSGWSTLFCFSLIVYLPITSAVVASILMFLIGFCCCGYLLCFAISDDMAPRKMKNTFTGFTNAICMITAPVLQPFVGYILDFQQITAGQYTLHSYRSGLSVIVFAILGAIVLAWRMPETFKSK